MPILESRPTGPYLAKQARSRDRAEQIIESTEALMLKPGPEEIGVRDLCAAAKASSSSFYARFTNREILFRAIWRRFVDRVYASLLKLEELEAVRSSLPHAIFHLSLTTLDLWHQNAWLIRRLRRAESKDRQLILLRQRFEKTLIADVLTALGRWHPEHDPKTLRSRIGEAMPTLAATYRGLAFENEWDFPDEPARNWGADRIRMATDITRLFERNFNSDCDCLHDTTASTFTDRAGSGSASGSI